MAAFKTIFKAVSHSVGELAVGGGLLLSAFALGVIKGSEAKPVINDIGDALKEKINEVAESTEEATEEPAEEEAESEVEEEETPTITVSTNQPED